MHASRHYFKLANHIYAAQFHQQTILLDAEKNEYLSLTGKSCQYFDYILSNEFFCEDNIFYSNIICFNSDSESSKILEIDPDELNIYINNYIERKIIYSSNIPFKLEMAKAANPVGISEKEWLTTIDPLKHKATFFGCIEAWLTLYRSHSIIKNKGIQGLITALNFKTKINKDGPSYLKPNEIDRLCYTLDKACLWYPKKSLCLVYAFALMQLLQKRHCPATFLIGVQTMPFYAHAWVEIQSQVINDNPQLKERLARILKLEFLNQH